jgi:predicted adenylyl cyclase CyaB
LYSISSFAILPPSVERARTRTAIVTTMAPRQNLEIKCIYPDHRWAGIVALEQLEAVYHGRLIQTDTYFHIRPGRLKLRSERHEFADRKSAPIARCELIHYSRPNCRAPKASQYRLLEVEDEQKALAFFTSALGIKVRVHKVRRLFLKDNLRIHLDSVSGLGKFLEFELIVSREYPLGRCEQQMADLLNMYRIAKSSLLRFSYSDLLLQRSTPT